MSGAPVFMPGALVFVTSARGITVDHLALVAMGTWFPGSHRTVTMKETVIVRLPHPSNCTDSRLKPPKPFCERGLSWSYSLRSRHQVWYIPRL